MSKETLRRLVETALQRQQMSAAIKAHRPEGLSLLFHGEMVGGQAKSGRPAVVDALSQMRRIFATSAISEIVIVTPTGADGKPTVPNPAGLRILGQIATSHASNNIRVLSVLEAEQLVRAGSLEPRAK